MPGDRLTRRREAKERTCLADAKVEEYRQAAKQSRRQLEELSKSYNNSENLEHKDKYKRLKAEVNGSGNTLM
jgi:hypothetical protein